MDDNRLPRSWYAKVGSFLAGVVKNGSRQYVTARNERLVKMENPDVRTTASLVDKRVKVVVPSDDSQGNTLNLAAGYPRNAPLKHKWN